MKAHDAQTSSVTACEGSDQRPLPQNTGQNSHVCWFWSQKCGSNSLLQLSALAKSGADGYNGRVWAPTLLLRKTKAHASVQRALMSCHPAYNLLIGHAER